MTRSRKRSRRRGRVDTSRADLPALAALAAASISRHDLRSRGHRPMMASSDLHPHGYTVRHWVVPGAPASEVLEYNPRLSDLPRVTASCYAEQAAFHRALGINLVPPGERWTDFGQGGLFDGILGGVGRAG